MAFAAGAFAAGAFAAGAFAAGALPAGTGALSAASEVDNSAPPTATLNASQVVRRDAVRRPEVTPYLPPFSRLAQVDCACSLDKPSKAALADSNAALYSCELRASVS